MPRDLLLQTHLTLSGHMIGRDEDMSWIEMNWDEAMKAYIDTLTSRFNHIVLGRKLAEGFIPAWLSRPSDGEGVAQFNGAGKTVFSRTLQAVPEAWKGKGEVEVFAPEKTGEGEEGRGLVEKVKELKAEREGLITAYGGGEVVEQLLEAGLVDEVVLLISPVVLEDGVRFLTNRTDFQLIEAKGFECGIVVVRYMVKK